MVKLFGILKNLIGDHESSVRARYSLWTPIYETAHRLQTLGTDGEYRKLAAYELDLKDGDVILDIGTGTGLTGLEVLKIAEEKNIDVKVYGVDFTYEMPAQGKKNNVNNQYEDQFDLINANAQELPFADNTFDKIIGVYGIGGIYDREQAFEEISRVAKPEAQVAFVDITSPTIYKPLKYLVHKAFTHIEVNLLWGFRDTNLFYLCEKNRISVRKKYLNDKILGSSQFVYGTVKK